jgi:formate dehydrogenase subunit delta
MITDKLVMMANQIAANNNYLSTDDAARRVATHLNQFWTPEMRKELEELASASADEAGSTEDPLSPVVRAALTQVH